jgi:superfamily II DNA or RNA helicase
MHQLARPYQSELYDAVKDAIRRGKKRILVQLPTGGGKTFVGCWFMLGCEQKGNHSMFMAPRRELVYQSANRLKEAGVVPGIIMAGEPINYHRKSQVASFDTLHSRAIKRENMPLPPSKLVIADEAHLTLADTRQAILDEYQGAIVIGLSATPAGPDGKPMGEVYDELIVGWSTRKMMDEGYLVEARYVAPTEPDLRRVKLDANGDYQAKALGSVMNKPKLIGDVVDNWFKHARDRRTVVFCVSRAHARNVCEKFVERGIAAEYVDGETPNEQRKEIFKRVESGKTQVLVNVFVASYGLDIPILDCVVIARPTKSLVLYLQMAGRGLRPVYCPMMPLDTAEQRLAAIAASVKKDLMVIDHGGVVMRLGFVDDFIPWTLEGDETIQDAKERVAGERKEPKELTCPACTAVFKGRRFCPRCGFEMVPPGEDVPTHTAELVEIRPTDGKEANRKTSWEDKAIFYGEARAYAAAKGKQPGFAAHLYRDKFGVWPNDERVRNAPPRPPTALIKGFIQHRNIRRRNQRAA